MANKDIRIWHESLPIEITNLTKKEIEKLEENFRKNKSKKSELKIINNS